MAGAFSTADATGRDRAGTGLSPSLQGDGTMPDVVVDPDIAFVIHHTDAAAVQAVTAGGDGNAVTGT